MTRHCCCRRLWASRDCEIEPQLNTWASETALAQNGVACERGVHGNRNLAATALAHLLCNKRRVCEEYARVALRLARRERQAMVSCSVTRSETNLGGFRRMERVCGFACWFLVDRRFCISNLTELVSFCSACQLDCVALGRFRVHYLLNYHVSHHYLTATCSGLF